MLCFSVLNKVIRNALLALSQRGYLSVFFFASTVKYRCVKLNVNIDVMAFRADDVRQALRAAQSSDQCGKTARWERSPQLP